MGNKIKYIYRDKEFFPRMWSDRKLRDTIDGEEREWYKP